MQEVFLFTVYNRNGDVVAQDAVEASEFEEGRDFARCEVYNRKGSHYTAQFGLMDEEGNVNTELKGTG